VCTACTHMYSICVCVCVCVHESILSVMNAWFVVECAVWSVTQWLLSGIVHGVMNLWIQHRPMLLQIGA
jgi:hypothetical protein